MFNIQYPTFGIEYLAIDARRLESGISFKNKSAQPANLANVQPVGSPIFDIQYPTFGVECLAFDAQSREAGIGFKVLKLEQAKLANV